MKVGQEVFILQEAGGYAADGKQVFAARVVSLDADTAVLVLPATAKKDPDGVWVPDAGTWSGYYVYTRFVPTTEVYADRAAALAAARAAAGEGAT